MKLTGTCAAKHTLFVVGIMSVIVLCMLYPFLPGDYDHAAIALSLMAQMFGVTGLLLVPIGIAWLVYELRSAHRQKRFHFALAAMLTGSVVAVTIFFMGFANMTVSLGAVAFALWAYAVVRLIPKLRAMKTAGGGFNAVPVYLIVLPVLTLVLQLVLAGPMTHWSRNRAIAHSAEFRSHVDAYRAKHGRYPGSVLGNWKDYYPRVIGVEKYHYTSFGDSYNLFFEQPRFLLDQFGTEEIVVYNPRNEHVIYSHSSWFLFVAPDEIARRAQGWYATRDTAHPHWKLFLFD